MAETKAVCTVCGKTPPTGPWRECSHVDCPNRRPITAQAPTHEGYASGAIPPKNSHE